MDLKTFYASREYQNRETACELLAQGAKELKRLQEKANTMSSSFPSHDSLNNQMIWLKDWFVAYNELESQENAMVLLNKNFDEAHKKLVQLWKV